MAVNVNGKSLETDEEGYLLDPSEWDEGVAHKIAEGEQLEMTAERWNVVNFVREFYEANHSVPEARVLLKAMANAWARSRPRVSTSISCSPMVMANRRARSPACANRRNSCSMFSNWLTARSGSRSAVTRIPLHLATLSLSALHIRLR